MTKESYSPTFLEKRLGKPIWQLSKTLRSTEENKANFLTVLDKLKTNSLLIYFNHFTLLDPGIIFRQLDKESLIDKVHVFVSQKHLDKQRNRFQSFVLYSVKEYKKFEILPVVQTYDQASYKDYTNLNRDSLIKAVRLLREKGNIVLIAPEGTRSKTGGLLKAEEGMGELLKIAKNTALAYPIAMENKKIFPYLTDTNIFFAKSAFSFEEIEIEAKKNNVSITEVLMMKLALLLPEKNRGEYAKRITA